MKTIFALILSLFAFPALALEGLYAENDTTTPATTMQVTISGTTYSSSITGQGYAAGDLVGFYFTGTVVVNSKTPIVGATYLFSLPMIGSATLLPLEPQGGSTGFYVIDDEVFYQNPPLIAAGGLIAHPPIYTLPYDLKPWVPAGARKVWWNMDAEIHSAGAVIAGAVVIGPHGNVKNISLYPPAGWWAPQDVFTSTSLKDSNQTFTLWIQNNGGGTIDNILAFAFVEGYKL